MLAMATTWTEFFQQLILTLLPVVVGWLGHVLGANGAPKLPGPQTTNPPT